MLWINLAAALILIGLIAYALLAGADFGGGVWDLFASGPRKQDQRDAINHAMGPVWEANHVWLIFVIVLLFTCFPYGYAPLTTALFIPLHLALLGIMLRGAAFVFRNYPRRTPTLPGEHLHTSVWQTVFGISSTISPILLGAAFGCLTSGAIRVQEGVASVTTPLPWLTPYAIGCGLLALATCAYLAAVYLCLETSGPLRDDFRRRAIIGGTATAALAAMVLVLAYVEARWFFDRLLSPANLPIVIAGLACFGLSAWSVFTRRYLLARLFAAGEITLLLAGWAAAQRPYLLYPDLTLDQAAGPQATTRFLVIATLAGLPLLVASLWLLFRIFKSAPAPGQPAASPTPPAAS